MSHKFRIGTFNIGSGFGDYEEMLKNFPDLHKQLTAEKAKLKQKEITTRGYTAGGLNNRLIAEAVEKVAEEAIMARIEPVIAKKLADRCDVICLQEVTNASRPFIQTLQQAGFEFFYPPGSNNFSTAVAVRRGIFDHVRNISILSDSSHIGTLDSQKSIVGQEIAGILATIKGTNIQIAICSLHSWGLPLAPPDGPKREYTKYDTQVAMPRIDRYINEAIFHLKTNYPVAFSLMAGDMNNNPHNYQGAFDIIEKAGFQTLEPDEATDINGVEKDDDLENPKPLYLYRKIDFIFPLLPKIGRISRIWSAFVSLFICKTPIFSVSAAKVMKDINYSYAGNCSDHRPVVIDLTIKTQSTIAWLWSYLMGKKSNTA